MVPGRLLALLVLTAVAAGCASPRPDPPAPPVSSDEPVPPGVKPGDPVAPRNLSAAPVWQLSEYWEYEAIEHFTGSRISTVRVVAGFEGPNYLVGMPVEKWSNEFMLLHIPGFGEVNRTKLSFETHDVPFEPLSFPLELGKKWQTHFEGVTYDAEVTAIEGVRARIEFSPGDDGDDSTPDGDHRFYAVYDAVVGEIVEYNDPFYATYRITEHGFNYTGRVIVPHGHDLVFYNFRVAQVNVVDPAATVTAPMEETVNIAATYDRVSFVLIVGTNVHAAAPQTLYRERVTAPNGTVFELAATPSDAPGRLKLSFHEYAKPEGAWKLEHLAPGPGLAAIEGIGYHSYEVDMPEGHIRASHGNHPHGSEKDG